MVSVGRHLPRTLILTINLLIVMQKSERVEIHIAMERHMRPVDALVMPFPGMSNDILNTPIPSVGEDQLLFVKRSRLEPAHVSVSGRW